MPEAIHQRALLAHSIHLTPYRRFFDLKPMPIFSKAQGVVVNNSQFMDVQQISNCSSGPTGIEVLLEASTPEAAHNSSARDPAPKCHPGTREQYVEDIVQWAIPAIGATPLPILWMNGPAGVGKSAVAQTCAEKLKDRGKLGAAFFFSINGRNKPTRFFTTIAYQLSAEFPDYHDLVERKVRRDKTLVDKTLASQFNELIVEPLRELERDGKSVGKRIAIFVDGLDECEGEDAQCAIIEIVAKAAREGATPLCWAFFSRPEPRIAAMFSRVDIAQLCYATILPITRDADRDIEFYLRAGFENILRHHNISTKSPWPPEDDIKALVNAAGGLFIYPASILRFIAQSGALGPEEPLRAVLAVISNRTNIPSDSKSPFAELDAFYTLIMRRIPAKMLPSIRLLLAILSHLDSPLSVILMGNVLRLSRMQFQAICSRLNAVLRVSDQDKVPDLDCGIDTSRSYYQQTNVDFQELWSSVYSQLGGRVSFYHKSFRDFLIDPNRSDIFWFKPFAIYQDLFEHCYKLRLDSEENYSIRCSKLALAPHIRNSASSLPYPHTTELTNSIIRAEAHCSVANLCSRLADQPELDMDLLRKHGCADFRKTLYIYAGLHPGYSACRLWDFDGRMKVVRGTILSRLHPREFPKFDVIEFKKTIARRQQAGVLQPYFSTLASWLWSFFPSVPNRIESGLYLVGHGSKSTFWYWEFNAAEKYYQEFSTDNLAKGERLYQEERFDLWFKEDDKA